MVLLILVFFIGPLVEFAAYLAPSLYDCLYKFFSYSLTLWIQWRFDCWRGRGFLLTEFTVFCHGCIVAREADLATIVKIVVFANWNIILCIISAAAENKNVHFAVNYWVRQNYHIMKYCCSKSLALIATIRYNLFRDGLFRIF